MTTAAIARSPVDKGRFSLENPLQSFLCKPPPPGLSYFPNGRWARQCRTSRAASRCDRDGESVREIARSYNVSQATISRLTA
jgi:hypothetical protein